MTTYPCASCKRTLPVAADQTDPADDEVTIDSRGDVSRDNYVCGRCLGKALDALADWRRAVQAGATPAPYTHTSGR